MRLVDVGIGRAQSVVAIDARGGSRDERAKDATLVRKPRGASGSGGTTEVGKPGHTEAWLRGLAHR